MDTDWELILYCYRAAKCRLAHKNPLVQSTSQWVFYFNVGTPAVLWTVSLSTHIVSFPVWRVDEPPLTPSSGGRLGGSGWWCLAFCPEPGHGVSVGWGHRDWADLKEHRVLSKSAVPKDQTLTFILIQDSKVQDQCAVSGRGAGHWEMWREDCEVREGSAAWRKWQLVHRREEKLNTNGKGQLMTTQSAMLK